MPPVLTIHRPNYGWHADDKGSSRHKSVFHPGYEVRYFRVGNMLQSFHACQQFEFLTYISDRAIEPLYIWIEGSRKCYGLR